MNKAKAPNIGASPYRQMDCLSNRLAAAIQLLEVVEIKADGLTVLIMSNRQIGGRL